MTALLRRLSGGIALKHVEVKSQEEWRQSGWPAPCIEPAQCRALKGHWVAVSAENWYDAALRGLQNASCKLQQVEESPS